MKKTILIALLIFSLPILLFCQTKLNKPKFSDIEQQINNEMDSIRNGSMKIHDYHFDSSNEKQFFEYVKKFDHDESVRVRSRVQIFKVGIVFSTKNASLRKEIVEDLIKDASNSEQIISQYALNRLLSYKIKQNDFSNNAKELLVSIFKQSKFSNDFLMICGEAQVKELFGKIKDISNRFNKETPLWRGTKEWYASLAAARRGDIEKLDGLNSAVETEL